MSVNKMILSLIIFLFTLNAYAIDIVMVHSYSQDFPWVKEYKKGIKSIINDYSVLEFEMDTKRKNAAEFEISADQAWSFIQQHNPKLVVLADDNALRLVGPRVVEAAIPLVFLGINANPRNYIEINSNVTGVLERPLLKRAISLLRNILPRLQKVLVLMDLSPTSSVIYERSFDDEVKHSIAGIQVDVSLESNFSGWKKQINHSKMANYDAIILANYASLSNEMGKKSQPIEVIEWSNFNSPIPLFAFWSYSIGKGKAIGGLNISGVEQGSEAAMKINEFFLKGKFPIVTTPSRGTFIFSQHELHRWNLMLPEYIINNSVILE